MPDYQSEWYSDISEEEYFEVLEETEFYFEIQSSPTDYSLPPEEGKEDEPVKLWPAINLGEVRVISMDESCGTDVRRAQGASASAGILVANGTMIRYEVGIRAAHKPATRLP